MKKLLLFFAGGKHTKMRIIVRTVPILMLSASILHGGSFQVSPVRIFWEGGSKTSSIRVKNQDESKVTVQLTVVKWTQDEKGEDIYEPAKEIIFFPRIFSINPGEEMIVRISDQGSGVSDERTYRLFVRELPLFVEGKPVLRMPLQFGIPIFISQKAESVEGNVEKIEVLPDKLRMVINNTGKKHMQIQNIEAIGMDQALSVVFTRKMAGWYVLPGSSKVFEMPITQQECRSSKSVRVIAGGSDFNFQSEFEVHDSPCAR
jgi:fimbrial chaperone protein